MPESPLMAEFNAVADKLHYLKREHALVGDYFSIPARRHASAPTPWSMNFAGCAVRWRRHPAASAW
jgi:hypothetical protein